MKKYLIAIQIIWLSCSIANGQSGQSIIEDTKGNSSIFLPGGGTIRLNVTDASLKLSFSNYAPPTNEKKPLFYGMEISGRTNDGILSLISNGNISPGARVNGIIGKDIFNRASGDTRQILVKAILRVGYEGSSFRLFNPDVTFAKQIKRVSFNSFVTNLSFNFKVGGNFLAGVSAGYQKVNNYDDLDEIELKDVNTINDSIGGTVRTYENSIKVRAGNYETFYQIPINVDLFWIPTNRVGIYGYWRTRITDQQTVNGVGTGMYFLESHNPFASKLGVVIEAADISRFKDGYGKNFTVNLVIGYNFSFKNDN